MKLLVLNLIFCSLYLGNANVTVGGKVVFTGNGIISSETNTSSVVPAESLTNSIQFSVPMDRLAAREVINGNNLTTVGTALGLVLMNNDPSVFPYNPIIDRCLNGGGASSGFKLQHTDNAALALGTNDFTISCWVHANGSAWPGSFPTFVGKDDFFAGGKSGYLVYYSSGAGLTARVGDGTSYAQVTSSLGASPSTTTWLHLTLRGDWTNHLITLSVNGTQTMNSVSWTNRVNSSENFTLFGNSADTANCWGGLLDEVNGWNRCLTGDEVQKIYTYGSTKGQGYPWGTQTNNTVILVGDARFLYPIAFPEIAQDFSLLSWVSNHNAKVFCASNPPYAGRSAMYVSATGDPVYKAPLIYQNTNIVKHVGSGTNAYVIPYTIINDIILLNGGTWTNWENLPQTNFTITNVVTSLTNSFDLFWAAGIQGLFVSTISSVVDWAGSSPQEQSWLNYGNTVISNYSHRTAFWDAATFMGTNYVNASLSEYNSLGCLLFASNWNVKFEAVLP